MGDKTRFGIIGTGPMAARMLQSMRTLGSIEVTSVFSPTPARAREFAQRQGIRSSHEDLTAFLGAGIDAVYIANRNVDHASAAIAALEAGKAVLCEKPFATGSAQGLAVVAAARAARCLFMEAMWTPFLPAYERLHEHVRSRRFGVPGYLHFEFGLPATVATHPALFARPGGGVLLDRAGYGISFALRSLGGVDEVQASVQVNDAGVDVAAYLQLTHGAGGRSHLAFSMASLMPNTASIAFAGGVAGLVAPTIGSEGFFHAAARAAAAPGAQAGAVGARHRLTQTLRELSLVRRLNEVYRRPRVMRCSFGLDMYAHQLRHFVGLRQGGRIESDVNTWATSITTVEIIEAAGKAGTVMAARAIATP